MPELSRLEQQVYNSLLAREAKYSKQIQQQLASALKSIYGEMKAIYNKYSINGKLTKAEMVKYNKYSTMEKAILAKLDPAIKANIKTIQKLLPSQFQESFFREAWAVDNASELRLSWGLVNTKSLLAAFDITNPKNIELQNALKNYGPTAKKSIRTALLNGLSEGKSYDQMARDVKKAVKKIYSSAITIVRTEGQAAINAGQDLAYYRAIENGVEGKVVWSATKDSVTRHTHRIMDGKAKLNTGFFEPIHAQYPGDPNLSAEERCNCRCRTRFEIDGYSPQLMRTREEGVIEYQNFSDYSKQYHPDWLKNEK